MKDYGYKLCYKELGKEKLKIYILGAMARSLV